jgi:lipoprotein-anchoring transpeptidase ErfK/SrfK
MTARDSDAGASPAGGLTRRLFVVGAAAFVAGCTSARFQNTPQARIFGDDVFYGGMYGPISTEPFPIPAVNLSQINPEFYRRRVSVPGNVPSKPGTIVIDPGARHLYLVQEDNQAIRYGIGVGREGFGWNGVATVSRKQEWPKWFPPKEMVARDPRAAPYANGMDGGLENPLGARALYLFQGQKDTLYRIHGTNEPWSIGKAVSSGCIRMLNQDVIDLYGRVPIGTVVTVLPTAGSPVAAVSDDDDSRG